MIEYAATDVTFEVPDDWRDRTITAFASPAAVGEAAFTLVVTRDTPADGEAIEAYADRQLVELAKRLQRFELTRRVEVLVDGRPAVALVFTWDGPAGSLWQHQTFALAADRTVMCFTATAPQERYRALRDALEGILASVRFP